MFESYLKHLKNNKRSNIIETNTKKGKINFLDCKTLPACSDRTIEKERKEERREKKGEKENCKPFSLSNISNIGGMVSMATSTKFIIQ